MSSDSSTSSARLPSSTRSTASWPATSTHVGSPRKSTSTEITLVAGGDDIPQAAINASAKKFGGSDGYDFTPIFAAIKPLVSSADLALCQMEGTLRSDKTNLTTPQENNGLRHRGPKEFARDLAWTGYDGCSTANNHSFDGGLRGLSDTRNVLAANGMKAAGPGPDAATPGQPAIYEVKGIKVAHLAYSYDVANGTEYPTQAPWTKANTLYSHSAAAMIADARAARAAGASIVLVSMHWGKQFVVEPSAEETRFSTALLQSGAVDQIIGNHPHLVQPSVRINGRIVNYAFGNQVSDQRAGYPPANDTHPSALTNAQDSVLGKFTFTVESGKVVKVTGQYQVARTDVRAGYVIRLVSKTSDPTTWKRTTRQLTRLGDSCGLTPLS